jgi:hypothetical protein
MTKLLGMMLLDGGEITSSQLAEVLNFQDENGGYLGEILIKKGYIKEKTLNVYLKKQRELRGSDNTEQ